MLLSLSARFPSSPVLLFARYPENMEVATKKPGSMDSYFHSTRGGDGGVWCAWISRCWISVRGVVHSRARACLCHPPSPCGEPDVSVARELDRSGWIDRDATVIAGLVRLQCGSIWEVSHSD